MARFKYFSQFNDLLLNSYSSLFYFVGTKVSVIVVNLTFKKNTIFSITKRVFKSRWFRLIQNFFYRKKKPKHFIPSLSFYFVGCYESSYISCVSHWKIKRVSNIQYRENWKQSYLPFLLCISPSPFSDDTLSLNDSQNAPIALLLEGFRRNTATYGNGRELPKRQIGQNYAKSSKQRCLWTNSSALLVDVERCWVSSPNCLECEVAP